MKEILCGMAIGVVVGALLYKNNDTAKEIVNKGQKMIEKEVQEMSKNKSKKD